MFIGFFFSILVLFVVNENSTSTSTWYSAMSVSQDVTPRKIYSKGAGGGGAQLSCDSEYLASTNITKKIEIAPAIKNTRDKPFIQIWP